LSLSYCFILQLVCIAGEILRVRSTTSDDDRGVFILSLVSSNASTVNSDDNMTQFSLSDTSDVYEKRAFNNSNTTLWGTSDKTTGRYFLVRVTGQVSVFNSTTLEALPELSWSPLVDYADEPPAACHFETATNLLWFSWTKVMPDASILENKFCSLDASSSIGTHRCFPFGHGQDDYLYVVDASAYDEVNGLMWQQAYNNAGYLLFAFDTSTKRIVKEVPVKGICQGMQIAYVNGEYQLLCVLYGDLVQIFTTYGTVKRLVSRLPPLSTYLLHSSTVSSDRNRSTSLYFAQVQDTTGNSWLQIDVASGALLTTSRSTADPASLISMPVVVGV